MNSLDIICFDFETGELVPGHSEAIQIAAKAYNARTLEPYPVSQGGEFNSLMKPLYPERLQDGALNVNIITRKELETAPDQKAVWISFAQWVMQYNKKKNMFGAPIAAGKNIRNFDLKFVAELNKLHLPKKEKSILFSKRREIELEDLMFAWFENSDEMPNEKMDTIRDYFGLSHERSHDALQDSRQTGEIIMRILKLHRSLRERRCKDGSEFIKFKNACRNSTVGV